MKQFMARVNFLVLTISLASIFSVVNSATDSNDLVIIREFLKGIQNPETLNWEGDDPCGSWKFIFCHGTRITQIQTKDINLHGSLPQNLNKLSELTDLGLQNNNLSGTLPSLSGLSKLKRAFFGNNKFDTIPSDFFTGLESLQVISLERNPLNATTGWVLPSDLKSSIQLTNLSLSQCNLVGKMPDFLGSMSSLMLLDMSYNRLSGEIPTSYSGLPLQILKLNNQDGSGLSGGIDVIASMTQLSLVWIHGNAFTGPIPEAIGACTSLKEFVINNNKLIGLVPTNLTTLPKLDMLQLQNNNLMGPIPKVSFTNFTFLPNKFCQSSPGMPCSPQVTALLNFLDHMNYPSEISDTWSGNNPCDSWRGIFCSNKNEVTRINLPNRQLNGTISPSLGTLISLTEISLEGNNINGTIPDDIAALPLLSTFNISGNDIAPPLPPFRKSVKLIIDGNPKLDNKTPPKSPPTTPSNDDNGNGSDTGNEPNGSNGSDGSNRSNGSDGSKLLVIIIPIVVGVVLICIVVLFVYCCKKVKNEDIPPPSSVVVHPRDSSDPENTVKIVVANNSATSSDLRTHTSGDTCDTHVIESGNLVISVQVLRSVTKNFSKEQELGRGGFGVVYKGELHDGTKIAVKRMESGVLSYKAFDEFEAEIAVLSKVRHRNLVSLLGFSAEGNEKLLVYEYMSMGALSRHLFHWKEYGLEPLTWKRRINIALDVARAMEYLHNLAHQSFIHRDLKSSNILLDDDYRAKVSDFGLVKLAPDGKYSVATRLAGTFGYLAPEYAVTGKVTTKVDVFSYGVVLIELITGMTALDEDRPEETRHLASWFYHIKSDKDKLRNYIDKSLNMSDETFEEMYIVGQLAGHCISREPNQRPDMGHAVNVLAPLVEKWKPVNNDSDDSVGIDLGQPLLELVKGWQDADGKNSSSLNLDDSKGSIPSRPAGFADSFTSADGR